VHVPGAGPAAVHELPPPARRHGILSGHHVEQTVLVVGDTV